MLGTGLRASTLAGVRNDTFGVVVAAGVAAVVVVPVGGLLFVVLIVAMPIGLVVQHL